MGKGCGVFKGCEGWRMRGLDEVWVRGGYEGWMRGG